MTELRTAAARELEEATQQPMSAPVRRRKSVNTVDLKNLQANGASNIEVLPPLAGNGDVGGAKPMARDSVGTSSDPTLGSHLSKDKQPLHSKSAPSTGNEDDIPEVEIPGVDGRALSPQPPRPPPETARRAKSPRPPPQFGPDAIHPSGATTARGAKTGGASSSIRSPSPDKRVNVAELKTSTLLISPESSRQLAMAFANAGDVISPKKGKSPLVRRVRRLSEGGGRALDDHSLHSRRQSTGGGVQQPRKAAYDSRRSRVPGLSHNQLKRDSSKGGKSSGGKKEKSAQSVVKTHADLSAQLETLTTTMNDLHQMQVKQLKSGNAKVGGLTNLAVRGQTAKGFSQLLGRANRKQPLQPPPPRPRPVPRIGQASPKKSPQKVAPKPQGASPLTRTRSEHLSQDVLMNGRQRAVIGAEGNKHHRKIDSLPMDSSIRSVTEVGTAPPTSYRSQPRGKVPRQLMEDSLELSESPLQVRANPDKAPAIHTEFIPDADEGLNSPGEPIRVDVHPVDDDLSSLLLASPVPRREQLNKSAPVSPQMSPVPSPEPMDPQELVSLNIDDDEAVSAQLHQSKHVASKISIITEVSDLESDVGRSPKPMMREGSDMLTYSQSLTEVMDIGASSSEAAPVDKASASTTNPEEDLRVRKAVASLDKSVISSDVSPDVVRLVEETVPTHVQSHMSSLQNRVFSLASHAQMQHAVNATLENAIAKSQPIEQCVREMLNILAKQTRSPAIAALRSFDERLEQLDVVHRVEDDAKLPMSMDLLSDICETHKTHVHKAHSSTLIAEALTVNTETLGTAALYYTRSLSDSEIKTMRDLLSSWISELSKYLGLLLSLRRKFYLRQEISDACKTGTFSEGINKAVEIATQATPLDTLCLLLFLPSAVEGVSVQYKVVKRNHVVFDSFGDARSGILTESFTDYNKSYGSLPAHVLNHVQTLNQSGSPTGSSNLSGSMKKGAFGHPRLADLKTSPPEPRSQRDNMSVAASADDSPPPSLHSRGNGSLNSEEAAYHSPSQKLSFLQLAYGNHQVELGESWRGPKVKEKKSSFDRFLAANMVALANEDVTGLRSHLGLDDDCTDIVIRGGGDSGDAPLARLLAESADGDNEIIEMLAEAILQRALHYHTEWKRLALYFNTEITKRLLNSLRYYERFLTPNTHQTAVMFTDLSSFTKLSEVVLGKPKLILSFIQHWSQFAIAAVKRSGGVFDKMIGDCIIAYWGPPFFEMPPEECCRRAIECATAIRHYTAVDLAVMADIAELKDPDVELGVSTGINYGDLCIGFCGEHAGYTGFSSAMNQTARLQGLASRNEILCMGTVKDVLGEDTPYPFGDEQRTSVKNVAEPLAYFPLQAPALPGPRPFGKSPAKTDTAADPASTTVQVDGGGGG